MTELRVDDEREVGNGLFRGSAMPLGVVDGI